ncbi:MAG: hypothetical protein LC792_27035 [Actinobacteria bacterium]|nr:hypothetical protein [Actinomycetota bacterium]
MAVVEAARQLFAKWKERGKDADLIIVVNPINRLFWRRWRIVEGLDLRVGLRRAGCGRCRELGARRLIRSRRRWGSRVAILMR